MNAIQPLWPHQEEGLQIGLKLFAHKQYGYLIACPMGLGKSRIAIELTIAEKSEQSLILCPKPVVEVWNKQIAQHAPGHFHFLALDERVGSVQEKYRKARELYQWSQEHHQPVVICINYESARLEPFGSWAANRIWGMVIADEIHRMKEPRGRASMWLAKLGLVAHRRLGLTGTPMPHIPLDIWAQFRFLNPYHLERSYGEFKSRYAVMGGYFDKQIVSWQNLDELEKRFRELAFRVDASVLNLPPEMDETRRADMGREGARIYREMEKEMIAQIEDGQVTAQNALVRLLRLAQITGGTLETDDGVIRAIDHAKEDLLEELLTDLREPVVVFCRFRADLEAVHRAAHRAELAPTCELSGSRDDLKLWQEAKSAEFPVLAVQIQAGGVGVDLTRARVAIYFSHDFSLANYLQSRARIHRPPQSRPCVFYHLLIRHSIDEYIMRALEARQDLVESVLNELKTKGASHVVTG